jgi:hypothetical protein
MEQTAVEWLVEKHFGGIVNCTPEFRRYIFQAAKIEKEEKHAEYMRGWKDGYSCKSIKNKIK